jgi:hypothetical protein
MSFTLKYSRGKSVKAQEVTDPSPEEIEQALDELLAALDYYVILEPSSPISNVAYIQTVIKVDDKPIVEYLVELSMETDDGSVWYRKYIEDANEVKKLFRMFALEVTPDITGWEDVTEDVKAQIEKWRKKKDG